MGGSGVVYGGEWAAGGRLIPLLGLFGLAMSPKVPAIGPNMFRRPKTSHYQWGEFQTCAFHVVSSIGLDHEFTGSEKLTLEE